MDPSAKKRKADENGINTTPNPNLTPEDVRKIIEPFTQDQLREILQSAALRHLDVLDSVRSLADQDPAQRKLFIRGLANETTTENLRSLFSTYGELAEAVVIQDKGTGKSKGFGFLTFKHVDGAVLALKEPSKPIDGRMTVTQLASMGNPNLQASGNLGVVGDVPNRKIYVWNVPFEMVPERLLTHFVSYGEIEEGPLGFDKITGKSRGFALFVYKNAEGANAAIVDPTKVIDGHQVMCKLAIDGKKGKPGVVGTVGAPGGENVGDGVGMQPPSSMPTSLTAQFGPPGGLSSYGGFSGTHQGPPVMMGHHHLNSSMPSPYGAPGLSSVPSSLGAGGGYAGSYGSYGGLGGGATAGVGGYGGYGGTGGSSLYRLPSGGYPDNMHYSLPSSAYPGQIHQPLGTSSAVPRLPVTGMYPGVPPYY